MMIGIFEDDADRLLAAVEYLERPPLEQLKALPAQSSDVADPSARMAPRTAQILRWRAEGVYFKEIGARLGISKQRVVQIWQRAQSDEPLYQTCTCGAVLTERATPGRPRMYCSRECRPWQMWAYGLTREQFDGLARLQNGLCGICALPETARTNDGKVKSLAIDHCHETGAARGFLCTRCNMGLGQCGDNAVVLVAAATYLRKHQVSTTAA